ncbi:MAG: endonuclease MutS2, partial [Candidatus Eisenbacteria bacterium]|nr:endonuclease MutS2 [Candidatus Eisenbacteria bacterium]
LEELAKDGRKAWVRAGPMRIQVDAAGLREADAASAAPEGGRVKISAAAPAGEESASELDLRGLDRLEGLQRLDLFLDRARLAGIQRVRILHGIGRGVLMNAVSQYLRDQSYVRSFRKGEPGEGGDGVTIAFLGETGGKGTRG